MKYRFLTALLLVVGMLPALSAARVAGLPLTAFSAGGTGLTPFYVLGFDLGPWQEYLARELTPDYLLDPTAEPLYISWINQQAVSILPVFAAELLGEPKTFLRFDVDWQRSDDLGITSFNDAFMTGIPGLERRLISSSLVHHLSDKQQYGNTDEIPMDQSGDIIVTFPLPETETPS